MAEFILFGLISFLIVIVLSSIIVSGVRFKDNVAIKLTLVISFICFCATICFGVITLIS